MTDIKTLDQIHQEVAGQDQQIIATIERWAGFDIDAWFADKQMQAKLATLLHEQFSCPKAIASIGVKASAHLVCQATKRGGSWLANSVMNKVINAALRHPQVDKFIAAMEKLLGGIDGKMAARTALEERIKNLAPDTEICKNQLDTGLLAHMATVDALSDIRDRLESLVNRQPILEARLFNQSETLRFVFGAQTVPFYGRDTEMAALASFTAGEGFGWTLVHGIGGMGKSRLALELLLRHGGAYESGFMPRDQISKVDWDTWEPYRPCLFVIDYAATEPAAVHGMLSALSKRSLDHDVRVVLLERTAQGAWLNTIEGAGTTAGTRIADSYVDTCQQALSAIDNVWPIFEAYFHRNKTPLPDQAVALASLERIDPQKRPLYAAFLADAMARGEETADWDKERLVRDVVNYEKAHYWTALGEADYNLLAVVTMVGGLSFEAVHAFCDSDTKAVLPAWDKTALPDRFTGVYDARPYEGLAPIEPDILGEVFVLQQMEQNPPVLEPLRQAAWWHMDGIGMADFIRRAARDFPGHAVIAELTKPVEGVTRSYATQFGLNPDITGQSCQTAFDALMAHADPAANIAAFDILEAALTKLYGVNDPDLSHFVDQALERLTTIPLANQTNRLAGGMIRFANVQERLGDYERVMELANTAKTLNADDAMNAFASGKLADILQARGDLDEALRIRTKEEIPVYEALGDKREIAIARGKIADILQARGDLDEALRIRIEEEIPVYEALGDKREIAIARGKFADLMQARGDLDGAIEIWTDELLPAFEALGDKRSIAVVSGKIADILEARGDFDEALRITMEEEIPVYQALGDKREIALARGKIADILEYRGEIDEALRIREEQITVYEALGDRRSIAVTRGKIADILQARGDLDEAFRIRTEEEIPVFEALGDKREIAVTRGKIADIFQARGDIDEALRIRTEEQIPVYEALGDKQGESVVRHRVATTLLQRDGLTKDNAQEVHEHLDKSFRAALEMKLPDGIAFAGSDLAQVLAMIGQTEPALQVLALSREGFVKLGHQDGIDHCDNLKAEIEQRGEGG